MRKVFLVLVMSGILVRPAAADSWANKIFGGQPNTPIVHDFGTVARGAQLQTTMRMTNLYKVPLQITKIHASCGCVEAKASVETLQPNQTGELLIKMDGTRFSGQKTVNIYVTFGPNFVSTANIVVSANARQDVVLNPGEIDFGSVSRGQSSSRSIEVECAGKKDWKVVKIQKSAKAPFDLRVENLPARITNGFPIIGYRLIASLRPDAPAGVFRETIDLETNDPQQPVVSFIIQGNIGTPVAVTPNPVQLVGLKVGDMKSQKVVITANKPFRITGVQNNGGDVNLIVPERPATPTHLLDLQIMPRVPGNLNREIVLQTDMQGETVRVIVQGTVNP